MSKGGESFYWGYRSRDRNIRYSNYIVYDLPVPSHDPDYSKSHDPKNAAEEKALSQARVEVSYIMDAIKRQTKFLKRRKNGPEKFALPRIYKEGSRLHFFWADLEDPSDRHELAYLLWPQIFTMFRIIEGPDRREIPVLIWPNIQYGTLPSFRIKTAYEAREALELRFDRQVRAIKGFKRLVGILSSALLLIFFMIFVP